MHDMLAPSADAATLAKQPLSGIVEARTVRLGTAQPGDRGVVSAVEIGKADADRGVDPAELHRRLLEFGFVEGARVEVLHEGAIWRDPIAVRLDDMRIALRRRDAWDVWVLLEPR
jgi:ferrous iron transport protein A